MAAMTAFVLTDENLARVKRNLRPLLPSVKSSHVSEALASALGYRTYAALLTELEKTDPSDPDIVSINEEAFLERLRQFGASIDLKTPVNGIFDKMHFRDFSPLIRTRYRTKQPISYKTPRAKAWRNLMVAATNAGIEQKLFSLRKDDNRWPGASDPKRMGATYRFDLNGMPAIAHVRDIGFGELAIHAALYPTADAENWIYASQAGFRAGEAYGMVWLERDRGAYLQTSLSFFRVRRAMVSRLANLEIRTKGYGDRGEVIM
jgi:hypothetical protein